mgnify:CR=1 FL=1
MESSKKGIYLLVSGMFIFSLQDILVKLLSDNVNLFQILFVRSIIAVIIVLLYVIINKETKLLSNSNLISTIIRSLLFFIGFTLFYYAQTQMPVANALTLFYVSPFFITIFSIVLLNEKIKLYRWLLMIVGFCGVYFVSNPEFEEFNYINLFPVFCAAFYGIFMVLTKLYSKNESSFSQLLFLNLGFMINSGLFGLIAGDGKYYINNNNLSMNFMLRAWDFSDINSLILILISGLSGSVGWILLILAYRTGSPSKITPFEYTGLIPTMLLGFIIWNDVSTVINLF